MQTRKFLTNYNRQGGLAAIAAIPLTLTEFLTNNNRQDTAAIAAIPLTLTTNNMIGHGVDQLLVLSLVVAFTSLFFLVYSCQ